VTLRTLGAVLPLALLACIGGGGAEVEQFAARDVARRHDAAVEDANARDARAPEDTGEPAADVAPQRDVPGPEDVPSDALCAPPPDAPPDTSPTDTATARDVRVDTGRPGPDDVGPVGCGPGRPGCSCYRPPRDEAGACWHSYGGRYADGACSGSYQCCDGAWRRGLDVCGACGCSEPTGRAGCVPHAAGDEVCFEAFSGRVEALPAAVREQMTGSSWRAGCPVGLDELSLLTMTHWGLDGVRHEGRLVVATSVAADVLGVFEHLYTHRFPIARMRLVDEYGADDDRSMAADNTSAFNCRRVTGGSAWSEHSYGTAIDISPVENPYVRGGTVLPPAGAAYVDREDVRPGMIVDPGPVTGAFRALEWGWGGDWGSLKDYQHFSESGR